jgi:hypothetical protein
MGIGNTTSAAAISYALYGGAASDWVGRGTGIDDIGLEKKVILEKYGIPDQVHEYSDNDYYWITYYDMFVDEYGKDRNIGFYFLYGRGDSMKDLCYTVKK